MEEKGKILIIDDNEDVLFALNMLLEPYMQKIKVTTQPARIEHFMRTFQPDVVLLDMNFRRDAVSGQEGVECLEQILNIDPQAVVIAFDRSLTYEKLCRTAYFLHRGLPGFATHPDVYCPTDRETWLIDCGAITRALEISTNTRIKTLGKPDPGMLREAAKRYGVDPHQCLMAGDRLATDISLGIHAGAVTCHILSPEADLLPPEGIVPDYQVRDLGELQTIWTNRERQQKNNKEKEL